MHAAAERGDIKKTVVKEFDKATNFKGLPESKDGYKKAKEFIKNKKKEK